MKALFFVWTVKDIVGLCIFGLMVLFVIGISIYEGIKSVINKIRKRRKNNE